MIVCACCLVLCFDWFSRFACVSAVSFVVWLLYSACSLLVVVCLNYFVTFFGFGLVFAGFGLLCVCV